VFIKKIVEMLTNCALIHALVLALLANILKIVIVMNAQMSATLCNTKMVVFVDHARFVIREKSLPGTHAIQHMTGYVGIALLLDSKQSETYACPAWMGTLNRMDPVSSVQPAITATTILRLNVLHPVFSATQVQPRYLRVYVHTQSTLWCTMRPLVSLCANERITETSVRMKIFFIAIITLIVSQKPAMVIVAVRLTNFASHLICPAQYIAHPTTLHHVPLDGIFLAEMHVFLVIKIDHTFALEERLHLDFALQNAYLVNTKRQYVLLLQTIFVYHVKRNFIVPM
jgi:hypothetical protein